MITSDYGAHYIAFALLCQLIRDGSKDILELIEIKLDELFDRGDRYYFIVTFLSILVLANDKEVEIIQEGLFDDIYVEGKE